MDRTLRAVKIGFCDRDKSFFNMEKVSVKDSLRGLFDVEISQVASLDDPAVCELDVLMVHAAASERMGDLITGLSKRAEASERLFPPTLIFAPVVMSELVPLVNMVREKNWYFDIVRPDQIDSLPVRFANLVRINEHLKELGRYEHRLTELEREVSAIKGRLEAEK